MDKNSSFESWMKEADGQVAAIAMLSAFDLADQTWRDWFESGLSPQEAAVTALENEGYPMDLLEEFEDPDGW